MSRLDPEPASPGRLELAITQWLFKRRGILCVLIMALTVAAGWQAAHLRVTDEIDIWLLEDDPGLFTHRDFQGRFGNDEVIAVALHDAAGFTSNDARRRLKSAAASLADVSGIAHVDSFLTMPSSEQSGSTSQILLSADGRHTLLIVQLADTGSEGKERSRIMAEITAKLDDLEYAHRLAGVGVLYTVLNRLSTVSSKRFIAAGYLIMLALLWFFYGRLRPTLLTLAIVTVSTVLTMGAYAASGRNINMLTMVMPTLIAVIGIAGSIHIFRQVAGRPRVHGRNDSVLRGVAWMLRPCAITTFTTAAGFAALCTSSLPVVRDLGLFSALGLIITLFVTIVFSLRGLTWPGFVPRKRRFDALRRVALRLSRLGSTRPNYVIGFAALWALFAIFGTSRLVVDTEPLDFLFPDHALRQNYAAIENKFGGITPINFVVESERGILQPDVLAAVQHWQRNAEDLTDIVWSFSLVEAAIAVGPEVRAEIVRDPGVFFASFLRCCPAVLSKMVAYLDPPDALRVTFATRMQSAAGITETIDAIRAAAQFPPGVNVRPAGYLPLYSRMVAQLVPAQIRSFALALLIISLTIAIAFRSIRLMLLSLPANLLPVLSVLGLMGWLGISLDVATVTIAAIVLGIVVDDTVMLLHGYQAQYRGRVPRKRAITAAVAGAGSSILMTSFVLTAGFLIYALADIKSIVYFGLLITTSMIIALLGDLILLPALITRYRFGDSTSVGTAPPQAVGASP